jgi:hypothetical protein
MKKQPREYDAALWGAAWRSIVVTLEMERLLCTRSVERAFRERNWSLRMATDIAEALQLETIEIGGKFYWQLSKTVVPILPRDYPRTYPNQAATGPSAA